MTIFNTSLNPESSNSEMNEAIELENLKASVKRALADCRLSRQERDDIMRRIYADHKVSVEECEIWRLLQEKIWKGEIQID